MHWHGLTSSGFSDYFLIFGVLSLFGWVGGMRLIRAQVLTLRRSEYVLAAEASGASTWRVLRQHLLPNVMPLIIVSASASLGAIAGSEIALTFLGVGVQPPHASFGVLITDGASRIALQHHPAAAARAGRDHRDADLRLQPARRRAERRLHARRALTDAVLVCQPSSRG